MNIFGRKKREDINEFLLEVSGLPEKTSYFGIQLNVKGHITGDDDLQIDGNIEGAIKTTSKVQMNASSVMNGDIQANEIINSGVINGNIIASDKLSLDNTARVNGRISTPVVSIAEGAIFDGEMEMDDSGIESR